MRLISVTAPAGEATRIASIAFSVGITKVSVQEGALLQSGAEPTPSETVEIATATPIAKEFLDSLLAAPFFDPALYTIAVRHPRSLITPEQPSDETVPVTMPTLDVYEDLWQFTHITASLVGRVFLASLLVGYGMIEMNLPVLIAGLLFLPYHHHMISVALSMCTREWRLLRQGATAFVATTALIVAGSAVVALLSEAPMEYDQFGSTLSGFLIALVIGAAAGFAALDDAGRRELIGLAATAHISILPAWLGISLVFGLPSSAETGKRILEFVIDVGTLTLSAAAVFALMRVQGDGIRAYARKSAARKNK
ncbi:DUF389 domain-containing protein [Noviherbaspirillum sp. ST9]|uniref:DUF389 domain-containing protein n=1 Tax=Noviherbaspirillum sp. ST9 TaxID=3401606 RepID=UPI003B58B06B